MEFDRRPQRHQLRLQEATVDDTADARVIGRIEQYEKWRLSFGGVTQLLQLLLRCRRKRRTEDRLGFLPEMRGPRQLIDPVVAEYGVHPIRRPDMISVGMHLAQQGVRIL